MFERQLRDLLAGVTLLVGHEGLVIAHRQQGQDGRLFLLLDRLGEVRDHQRQRAVVLDTFDKTAVGFDLPQQVA